MTADKIANTPAANTSGSAAKPATQRVADALQAAGLQAEIVEFPVSTRTAADAAAAIGTSVGQIVKSLIFMAGDRPVVALTSGTNMVDLDKLSAVSGATVRRASAAEVRDATGFAIGGVPPIGHTQQLTIFLDADLMEYDLVFAAAGTPNAVFGIAPADLQRICAAIVADIRQEIL